MGVKEKPNKFSLSLIILTSCLLVVSFLSFFSFYYYHHFGHINSVQSGFFSVFGWFKLAGLVAIPCAVFLKTNRFNAPIKFLLVLIPLISLAFIPYYMGQVNIPANYQQAIHHDMNNFMPCALVLALFIVEALLMSGIAVLFWVRDIKNTKLKLAENINKEQNDSLNELNKLNEEPNTQKNPPQSNKPNTQSNSKLNSFFNLVKSQSSKKEWLSFLFIFLASLPLNLFDNIFGYGRPVTPDSFAFSFLEVANFTMWHLLVFQAVFVLTFVAYKILKNKDSAARYRYLRVLSIVLAVQWMNRASMLIGDGYNIYYTIVSFIPLFICNIGVIVAIIAIFTKNKILQNISFFVHGAGALTVFFFFGRDEISNFGTIFNYSFIYFILTHIVLFMICVLPTLLKEHTFKAKNTLIPSAYYAVVILIAVLSAEGVTALTYNAYGIYGMIVPNFSFTQVSPIPNPIPPFYLNLGALSFDIIYLVILFFFYVAIFFTYWGGYLLIIELPKRVREKRKANSFDT